MAKQESLWDTREGWIFCLNAPEGDDNGSHWGYADDFIEIISVDDIDDIYGPAIGKGTVTVNSSVWGKPYSKFARLKAGDGVVFYHGKKARSLEVDIHYLAILIHSPPQIMLLAINLHKDFIDIEGIAVALVSPL